MNPRKKSLRSLDEHLKLLQLVQLPPLPDQNYPSPKTSSTSSSWYSSSLMILHHRRPVQRQPVEVAWGYKRSLDINLLPEYSILNQKDQRQEVKK